VASFRVRAARRVANGSARGRRCERAIARLRALFTGASDVSLDGVSPAPPSSSASPPRMLAFLSQIVLARGSAASSSAFMSMPGTWLLLIGGVGDLGLGSAAQRFIPEYAEHKQWRCCADFSPAARWLALIIATAVGSVAVGIIALSPLGNSTSFPARFALPALRCRPLRSPTCRAASRGPTTGSISG